VDFFHLQDLVGEDGSQSDCSRRLTTSPIRHCRRLSMRTSIIANARSSSSNHRNRRIADYVTKNPPEPPPVWTSQRFEAVLAYAEAVEQRELLA
jgi:hypothetical protein